MKPVTVRSSCPSLRFTSKKQSGGERLAVIEVVVDLGPAPGEGRVVVLGDGVAPDVRAVVLGSLEVEPGLELTDVRVGIAELTCDGVAAGVVDDRVREALARAVGEAVRRAGGLWLVDDDG